MSNPAKKQFEKIEKYRLKNDYKYRSCDICGDFVPVSEMQLHKIKCEVESYDINND